MAARLDAEAVREAARHRWRELLPRLGVPPDSLRNRHGPCPGCGGHDRFRFDDKNGRGTFFCSQGGGEPQAGDGFELLMHARGWRFPEALQAVADALGMGNGAAPPPPQRPKPCSAQQTDNTAAKTERARKLVAASQAPHGTLVEHYLRNRDLVLPGDSPLLFHPSAWHFKAQQRLPAMIAPIVPIAAPDGASVQAAHVTFLAPDGCGKAAVDPPRLYLGPTRGGVAKLTPDQNVTTGLALAEGVETALVGIALGLPTWACLDAGGMGRFPVLPGIEALTVLADNDDAGLSAARTVAARWQEAGREVRIVTPRAAKADINDVLRQVA